MQIAAELVASYRRFREIGLHLNSQMVKRLSADVLQEGGRDLRFLQKGTFAFDNEDETSVLMDYCIYNITRQGRNQIERYLADSPPPEGSDEWLHLQAMSRSWYTILYIEKTIPGSGAVVRDMLRQAEHILIDINISKSAPAGAMLATRVIPHDGFIMTSGASLPLSGGPVHCEQLVMRLTKTLFTANIKSFEHLDRIQEQRLTQTIITTARSWGASSQIAYADPEPIAKPSRRASARSGAGRRPRRP